MTFFSLYLVFCVSVADYNLDQGDGYVKIAVSRRKGMSKYFQLSNAALISYFSLLVKFSAPTTYLYRGTSKVLIVPKLH